MAVNKELKFNFSLDDQSFIKVKAALESLTNQAKELAKAMNAAGGMGGRGGGGILSSGTVTGGGGGFAAATSGASQSIKPGNNAMVQSIALTAEAFKKLGSISSGALKGVEDSFRRSINEQKSRAHELKNTLAELGDAYEGMANKGSKAAQDAAKKMEVLTEEMIAAEKKAASLEKRMGGGGIGSVASSAMGGLWNFTKGVGAVAGGLAIGGRLAGGIAGSINNAQTLSFDLQSQRGAAVNPSINRVLSGDMSQMVLMRGLAKRSAVDQGAFVNKFSGTAWETSHGARAVKEAAGGLTGSAMDMTAFTKEGIQTASMKDMLGAVDQFGQTTKGNQMLIGRHWLDETMGERIAANRFLGVGAKRRPDGTLVRADDSYADMRERLMSQGYGMGDYMSAAHQAMGVGGMALRNAFSGTIMSATAGGFGQLAPMLSQVGMANNQTLLGGSTALTRDAARGFFGGGMDPVAAMHLASIATRGGFDPTGSTSGQGLLAAFQTGMGGGGGLMDMKAISRLQAGLQAGNTMTQGGTGYDAGVRTLAAIKAAGPGASTYLQDYLASGMSATQLMDAVRGQGPEEFIKKGGTKEMAASMLGQTGTSYLNAYVVQGSGQDAEAVRRFRESGLSLQEYVQSNRGDISAIAAAMSGSSQGALTFEGAKAQLQLMSGDVNADIKKGRLPGAGKLDPISQLSADEKVAAEKERARLAYENMPEMFAKNAEEITKFIAHLTSFGDNLSANADLAAKSLFELAGATNMATEVVKRINERQDREARAKAGPTSAQKPAGFGLMGQKKF